MNKIFKDTLIGEALQIEPEIAPFLFEIGMHCLGCPSAASETIEEACEVHGADCEKLLTKINNLIASK